MYRWSIGQQSVLVSIRRFGNDLSLTSDSSTMDSLRSLCLSLALLSTLALVWGEVVTTQKCHQAKDETPACTVHEVRVIPCPEAATGRPCKLQLGSNASLEFDYTPKFSATKVGSQAFKVGTLLDIGFEQMDIDGCKYTTCPVEAGKKQSYKYNLEIGTQFPATTHQVKWKLWNQDDYHQQCCFKLSLQLYS